VDKESVLSVTGVKKSLPHELEPWLDGLYPAGCLEKEFSGQWKWLAPVRALRPSHRMSWVVIPVPSFLLSFHVTKQPHEGHQRGLWGPPLALHGVQHQA